MQLPNIDTIEADLCIRATNANNNSGDDADWNVLNSDMDKKRDQRGRQDYPGPGEAYIHLAADEQDMFNGAIDNLVITEEPRRRSELVVRVRLFCWRPLRTNERMFSHEEAVAFQQLFEWIRQEIVSTEEPVSVLLDPQTLAVHLATATEMVAEKEKQVREGGEEEEDEQDDAE